MKFKKKQCIPPPRLLPGDTIGIAAPASPFDMEEFNRGIAVIESMGFRTYVPEDISKKDGYLAGPDLHRAEMVNRLFGEKNIKAIICARGGFGSLRIVPSLDFESIRQNPKIFAGFSDISALLSVLAMKCGFVTFHAPVVTTLADATRETKDAMFAAFSSETKLEIRPKTGVVIKPGAASGPVSGGNLTTLCHLVGTPYQPGFQGHILFIEDRGEAAYRIDRMMTQMKMAGCFEGITGVILGSFEDCGDMNEIFGIVDRIFHGDAIPILGGFEIGHGKTNLTIPIGIEATIDAGTRTLSFHEPATVMV